MDQWKPEISNLNVDLNNCNSLSKHQNIPLSKLKTKNPANPTMDQMSQVNLSQFESS